MKLLIALLALSSALGCARIDAPRGEHRPLTIAFEAPEAPAAAPAAEPPALEGAPIQVLELEKGRAIVALPIGARDKRAVVVGVHGAGDRPEWSCSEWQAVTAGWAFVVCPQGVRHPQDPNAFVWGSAESIAAQADEAVKALRARYGPWVADGPLIYGGWSQGATLAAQVIASRPGTYDRAVLVEVGHTPLDANQVAASLLAGGVRRAVVSCSSLKCRTFAQTFKGSAERRGMPVRINDVGLRGHWFDAPVVRTLGPAFAWMVDDEARFAGLGAAVDARYSTD
ncbi:MAG TPA: hypothetical protein VLT33_18915 [Labilithrix sp.]|nr:hypothetical protein [Labilithrix sp.]